MKVFAVSATTNPISVENLVISLLGGGSQLKVRKLEMSVSYVNGEVEDDMQLAELIRDGHLSIGEPSCWHAARVMLR